MNIFRTKDGRIVIGQKPNLSLIIWFMLWLASKIADEKNAGILSTLSSIALIVWAMQEILTGVNLWRRLLGLVALSLSLRVIFF